MKPFKYRIFLVPWYGLHKQPPPFKKKKKRKKERKKNIRTKNKYENKQYTVTKPTIAQHQRRNVRLRQKKTLCIQDTIILCNCFLKHNWHVKSTNYGKTIWKWMALQLKLDIKDIGLTARSVISKEYVLFNSTEEQTRLEWPSFMGASQSMANLLCEAQNAYYWFVQACT